MDRSELDIVGGNKKDYNALAEYHYIKRPVGPVKKIYIIKERNPENHHYPHPVGVIVYSFPLSSLKPRSVATNGKYDKIADKKERMKAINSNFTYASRLIVDRRYWRCGLGTWLAHETFALQTTRYIETIMPIDFARKILTSYGFKISYTPAPTFYHVFEKALTRAGITGDLLKHPNIAQKRMNTLDLTQRKRLDHSINYFLDHFRRKNYFKTELDSIAFFLHKLNYPNAYFLYENPNCREI